MSYSDFRIVIKQGTKSGSAQPSPGGNGQTPINISAGPGHTEATNAEAATPPISLTFSIEDTLMITDPQPLPTAPGTFSFSRDLQPVNDYTLIANITEPAPQDVTLVGAVAYGTPPGEEVRRK